MHTYHGTSDPRKPLPRAAAPPAARHASKKLQNCETAPPPSLLPGSAESLSHLGRDIFAGLKDGGLKPLDRANLVRVPMCLIGTWCVA